MDVKFTAFCEAGIRRCNQDVWRVQEMPGRTLMVVCDGMGGHSMGDVAAETVCNTVCRFWEENPWCADSVNKVFEACAMAADALYARSRVVRPIEMGTTFVMASIEGDKVTIAHCGDSRCYLLRDGAVVHQTADHANPRLGPEAVSRCFFSFNPEVAVPDVVQLQLKEGDRIFLCTDGVYKSMAPEILAARLQDEKPLDAVVDVIKFMCEKFSTDNYTGILAQVE
ncbi:MAG: serine/threonine-protein phosphatase [Bacteroidales bacterium]|nr:serine/threonine-protein phosphatase [Bacteroidales bacterium]